MTGYQHIAASPWSTSLESFEGLPDFFEPRIAPEQRSAIGSSAHRAMAWVAHMLPGVALAFVLALVAYAISVRVHGAVSQITLAVVLGLILRNTVGVPQAYEAGLRFCLRNVLRAGIVVLGLTLSIVAVGRDARIGLPVMVCTIATAMIAVTFINRALGLPRRLGTLIAVGTSICGVSAIVATAPIIDANEDETSYAVACITIFGLLAMLCYPFLAHWIFSTPEQSGVFFGTAIHDMSQATGAGLAYAQQYEHGQSTAFHTAVTVKMVRNLWMSLLIPLAGIMYHRSERAHAPNARRRPRWHQIVPLFIIGFVLMACIRSLGDAEGQKAFGFLDRGQWDRVGVFAKFIVPWMLAISMAAVGLGTGLSNLKKLGWKPFSVGLAAALLVGIVSMTVIMLLAPFMHI
jgi:uncharacterized integral membrane protein (TIGR00698 family)